MAAGSSGGNYGEEANECAYQALQKSIPVFLFFFFSDESLGGPSAFLPGNRITISLISLLQWRRFARWFDFFFSRRFGLPVGGFGASGEVRRRGKCAVQGVMKCI